MAFIYINPKSYIATVNEMPRAVHEIVRRFNINNGYHITCLAFWMFQIYSNCRSLLIGGLDGSSFLCTYVLNVNRIITFFFIRHLIENKIVQFKNSGFIHIFSMCFNWRRFRLLNRTEQICNVSVFFFYVFNNFYICQYAKLTQWIISRPRFFLCDVNLLKQTFI